MLIVTRIVYVCHQVCNFFYTWSCVSTWDLEQYMSQWASHSTTYCTFSTRVSVVSKLSRTSNSMFRRTMARRCLSSSREPSKWVYSAGVPLHPHGQGLADRGRWCSHQIGCWLTVWMPAAVPPCVGGETRYCISQFVQIMENRKTLYVYVIGSEKTTLNKNET